MRRLMVVALTDAPAPYAETSALVGIISDLVTAAAVVVGGVWVYFKFVRGRTFKPRLAMALSGQWIPGDGTHLLLLARLALKNIGASKIGLRQAGTGLQVWVHTGEVGVGGPELEDAKAKFGELPERGTAVWRQYEAKFSIFDKHAWIEPSEQISDDRLVRFVNEVENGIVLLRARIVCERRFRKNIVVFGRSVVWSDSKAGAAGGLGASGPSEASGGKEVGNID